MAARRLVVGAMVLGLAAALGAAPPSADAAPPALFLVGADAEDIAPPPAMLADFVTNKNFFLGGYGLGSGQSQIGPNGFPVPGGSNRYAQGVMSSNLGHPFVRAIVISDGKRTIAFADLDNQGTFPAYKLNEQTLAARPYGFDDVRSKVAKDTGGGLSFFDMTISSDHSHGGQDMTGVWGFVPDNYLAFVHDQEVKALEAAYAKLQPATLMEGAVTTPGPCDNNRILEDQFDCSSPPNDVMDTELRTMQAFARSDGHLIVTLANFAAHATVMGSGNRLISPDWPGVAAHYLEQKYGGTALVVVADVGRSQPHRGGGNGVINLQCTAADISSGNYDEDTTTINGNDTTTEKAESCTLSKYSKAFIGWAQQAVANQTPLTLNTIDGRELFIHDCAFNAGLLALNDVGGAAGAPIARSNLPPYSLGDCFGMWVGAFRIGDVVITTNPGEAYPNMRQGFIAAVRGGRRYWTTGLSNDQLGYLIAPFPEGYPQAIQKGAGGNDNILFNPSATIGDHVMCTQIKGAIQMGLAQNAPTKCAAYQLEPNVYGPGGVDTGPAPVPPPRTDFNGNLVPEPGSAAAASGANALPNTAATRAGVGVAAGVVRAAQLVRDAAIPVLIAALWLIAGVVWLPMLRRRGSRS
ncbi:MAG: hypothetical protein WBD38_04475 [Candidatus Dormiibacterota bacterium]